MIRRTEAEEEGLCFYQIQLLGPCLREKYPHNNNYVQQLWVHRSLCAGGAVGDSDYMLRMKWPHILNLFILISAKNS